MFAYFFDLDAVLFGYIFDLLDYVAEAPEVVYHRVGFRSFVAVVFSGMFQFSDGNSRNPQLIEVFSALRFSL